MEVTSFKGSCLPGRADLGEWIKEGRTPNPRVLTHHLTHSFILSSTQLLLKLISVLNPFLKTYLRLPAGPKIKTTHLRPSKSSIIWGLLPLPHQCPNLSLDSTALHSGLHYCCLLQGVLLIVSPTRAPQPLTLLHIVPDIIAYINLLFLTSVSAFKMSVLCSSFS